MARLAVEGTREIHFDHHKGGDRAPVVLVHGWGMNGRVWDYVLPYLLRAGHDVVVADQRACGRSDRDFDDMGIETLGADVVALVDHLDLEPVVLNGWSAGGAVVTSAAASLGRRCAGLVLTCGAAPRFTNAEDWTHGIPADGIPDMIAALDDDPVTFLRAMSAGQAHVALDPAIIDWMWWIFNEAGARAHETLLDLAHVDLREAVAKITAPTLVFGGKHDPTVPFTIAEHQAETYPQAKLVALDTGHVPFIEAKAEYREALLDYLDQL
ncbi:Arylesterase [Nocardioides dokdonensis FR1436]|uniref:Arylesterase n=1 Tax=Nocardioides dokdonensis FR1436 TaxID=1300347 RepID=A0A1A9GN06_9ACTN|nr:alpha/beta hydrolase [Nocardioides dokdonensis]ANH38983.1 Arylesterase [Nocardioides dokdonensis FR1436]